MKKLIYTSGTILLMAICLSSCVKKKDYTCVCRYLATGSEISRSTISATSAENASDECDGKESAFLVGDHCEIE